MSAIDLVAFGDSVVWGQGLGHRDKFANVVHDWLEDGKTTAPRRRYSLPESHIQARSGAIIGDGNFAGDGHEPFPQSLSRIARHEVPNSAPTIREQVAAYPQSAFPDEVVSLPNPADVDIVIVDGGINDTGSMTPLDPSTPWSHLDQATERHAYRYMTALLEEVRETFPTALIVVTGYFPVFSWATDLDEAAAKLQASAASDTLAEDAAVSFLGSVFAAVDFFSDLGEEIVANMDYFHRRQLYQLRRAVSEFAVSADNLSGGVVFAHPGFGPRNALFAGDSWLFEPQEDGDPNVASERRVGCAATDQGAICEVANVAHPDIEGSTAYAEAIYDAVDRYATHSLRDDLEALGSPADGVRAACRRYGLDASDGLRACHGHRVVDCLEVTVDTASLELRMRDPDSVEGLSDMVATVAEYLHDNFETLRQAIIPGQTSRIDLEIETDADPIVVPLDHPNRVDFAAGTTGRYVLDPHLDPPRRMLELGEIRGLSLVKDQLFDELGDAAVDLVANLPVASDLAREAVQRLVYTEWQPERFALSVNGVPVHEESIATVLTGDDRWEVSYPR